MDQGVDFAADEIVRAGAILAARGWAPAGSGHYSHRRPGGFSITVSGARKGEISPAEVMRLDETGTALDARVPSAETALHLAVYRLAPDAQAVLHTHSIAAVVISRLIGDTLRLEGYELLKAFPGIATHACAVDLPVFDNSQDMTHLSGEVGARLGSRSAPAFLIRDHGLYG